MLLSIIAADNFGQKQKERFEMQMDSDRPSINKQMTYNSEGFKIVNKCQIDRYFTQGLEVLDDQKHLVVSSGWSRISKLVLIRFDLDSCKFEEVISKRMDAKYFAEGVTIVNDETIYQLTYKSGDVLTWQIEKEGDVYKDITLSSRSNRAEELSLKEGWGLVAREVNGKTLLYATDSTSVIKEIDPVTWKTVRKIEVIDPADGDRPVPYLNELEIIQTNSTTQ